MTYCTQDIAAIATIKLNSYLERQVQAIAPEQIRVYTPQRRANYSDKARIRRDRLKDIALKQQGWGSTTNVKKYLALLGVKLDLRLTSAWVALVHELKPYIEAAKAVVDALEQPKIPTNQELLEQAIADGVIASWEEDEEGGLYWIWRSTDSKRELVTSSGLAMYLRQLE